MKYFLVLFFSFVFLTFASENIDTNGDAADDFIIEEESVDEEAGLYELEIIVEPYFPEEEAQIPEVPSRFEKHRLFTGINSGVLLNHNRIPEGSVRGYTLPAISYELYFRPEKIVRFELDAAFGVYKSKELFDGKAEEDVFGNNTFFSVSPAFRLFLGNYFFYKNSFDFVYSSVTPQEEEATSYASSRLDVATSAGFDYGSTDIFALTPWGKFEKGLKAELYYVNGFYNSESGDVMDELSRRLGFEVSMPFYYEDTFFMYKPYVSYDTELNRKLVYPWWFTAGVSAAIDLREDININGRFCVRYGQIDPDKKLGLLMGTETFTSGEVEINYYLFYNIALSLGLQYDMLLFAEKGVQDDHPEILIKAAVNYISGFR